MTGLLLLQVQGLSTRFPGGIDDPKISALLYQ